MNNLCRVDEGWWVKGYIGSFWPKRIELGVYAETSDKELEIHNVASSDELNNDDMNTVTTNIDGSVSDDDISRPTVASPQF